MYNIDFILLILWNIAEELHKIKLLTYVHALVMPVKTLYYDFMEQRRRHWYEVNHNSQVCYMKAALNDAFDFDLRRITILKGNKFTRRYIYTRVENKPIYLGKIYLRPRNDYADTGVDFIVKVPAVLEPIVNKYAVIAKVESYALASKRFKVIYE